jgi:nicotinamide riboside kinase
MVKKVAIIGPESTGKSTLSARLAAHYKTLWVPEYARQYLSAHGMKYTYDSLLDIAKGQVALEEKYLTEVEHAASGNPQTAASAAAAISPGAANPQTAALPQATANPQTPASAGASGTAASSGLPPSPGAAISPQATANPERSRRVGPLNPPATETARTERSRSPVLFIDTEMYVMKVWCEFVYGKCHQYIIDQAVTRTYDLYLLCNTDIPWSPDVLREYPDPGPRQQLFCMYHDILVNQSTPWTIISGDNEERLQSAISAVNAIL